MFWDNYKGSTDLLTRWVYPPLVWPLVRAVHAPSASTRTPSPLVSIVLTFAAVPLFARGDWLAGFLCAYAMSVLDSVDGKVARLTLTDSKIGNVLDHGIDQVHPPFWYFAWAWGLGARTPDDPLYQAAIWLIVFYFADRIVLGVAKRRLGFALHAATRLDGRVRSCDRTAQHHDDDHGDRAAARRRARPGSGIVTAWQGLTFAWHAARTIWLGFLSRGAAPGGLMSGVEVIAVSTPAEMDRFIRLPCALYAGDPNFVPPLAARARGSALAASKNPYFQHAEAKFWLARQGRPRRRPHQCPDRPAGAGPGGRPLRHDRRRGRPEVFARPVRRRRRRGCASAASSACSGRSTSRSTRRAACSSTASTRRRCC